MNQSMHKSIVIVLTLAALGCIHSAGRAQDSWSLSISEKEMKLENPVDMMWDKWLMWDIGFQRMICRNEPYLELTNEAASTSTITQLHLTIGDNRFNFGAVDGSSLVLLGSTTPGFELSASTVDGLGDELVVNIGDGGLLPGETVRFKIKLNVDPSFAAAYQAAFGDSRPDFRTVLFDMNGVNVYDGIVDNSTEDNAQAFVTFNPGGQSTTEVFEDETVAAGQYFNNNLREYRAMDPVLIFQLEGEPIPEPGSVALLILAISSGLCLRRRVG